MDSTILWGLFLETGAPEIYMLYNKARRMEASDALENTGLSTPDIELQ